MNESISREKKKKVFDDGTKLAMSDRSPEDCFKVQSNLDKANKISMAKTVRYFKLVKANKYFD